MRSSLLKIIVILLFISTGNRLQCQNLSLKSNEINKAKLVETFDYSNFENSYNQSFFKQTDSYYNLQIFANSFKKFSASINMEMEEEPAYEEAINLLKDFIYFNVNLNYNLGKFSIAFSINNLFNFNNSEFSIQPELYGNNNVVKDFYFLYDQFFSIQTAITYTF